MQHILCNIDTLFDQTHMQQLHGMCATVFMSLNF